MISSETLYMCECAGQQVADDIGFDGAGQASTDPAAILQGGAIRPFDRCLRCCRAAVVSDIMVAPKKDLSPHSTLLWAQTVSRTLARKQADCDTLTGKLRRCADEQAALLQVLQGQLCEPPADPQQMTPPQCNLVGALAGLTRVATWR